MTPMELHAWTLRQWNVLSEVATNATQGAWCYDFTSVSMGGGGQARISKLSGGPSIVWGYFTNAADASYIVNFDPQMTVPLCRAALRRVNRHRPMTDEEYPICEYCSHEDGIMWPCHDFLGDLTPFTQHSEFPDEYRWLAS